MRPKKYPYSGVVKAKKTAKEDKLELVAFPNIAIRKDLLKHIYTVVKNHDGATIIYFRIPKILGYDEQRAKVNLSYEETIKILNSC
jgi:phage protein